MLTQKDQQQLSEKGISPETLNKQLKLFKTGFPFLKLSNAAGIGNGIIAPSNDECQRYIRIWEEYTNNRHSVVKFVPASGAASRMFKDLFAFLNAEYDVPTTEFEKEFFEHIRKFAFRKDLCKICKSSMQTNVCGLLEEGNYKAIVRALLEPDGLNYGSLPKGLLLFHNYDDGPRTSMEEHLVEAALYATVGGEANVHFTVSHEHLQLFKQNVEEKRAKYETMFGIKFHITFSEQKPCTDTVAANPDGTPFRNNNGEIIFRPGGHGALIENLNDIDADIIFIKNIDNVVPDRLKEPTVKWKKIIAGALVDIQEKTFTYLHKLETGNTTEAELKEIIQFVEKELCCLKKDIDTLGKTELICYLRNKLNRPIRVCGMVKNSGEPGGGPFLAYNSDNTISLQILESSQINQDNPNDRIMFKSGTHFNPVDLVCGLRDYKGQQFNLPRYVDSSTGFISKKSNNGRELLALELPGLWNGAMSNWNTIFIEVPLETFNPVKTVNDLFRPQHQ